MIRNGNHLKKLDQNRKNSFLTMYEYKNASEAKKGKNKCNDSMQQLKNSRGIHVKLILLTPAIAVCQIGHDALSRRETGLGS